MFLLEVEGGSVPTASVSFSKAVPCETAGRGIVGMPSPPIQLKDVQNEAAIAAIGYYLRLAGFARQDSVRGGERQGGGYARLRRR